MDRKLAHVEEILEIRPIPNADAIEVATVLGWECVVKKNEFQIGEKVVYIEVDSIVPTEPQFEFLKERKYRVRTIKLRGQVSQGLVLPISVLPKKKYRVGQDVTNILKITKYDPQLEKERKEVPIRLKNPFVKFMSRFKWFRDIFLKKTKGGFPSWISKTDEERIQNNPRILSLNIPYEVTEKLDGQSATYFLKKDGRKYEFGVCSRNLRLNTPDSSSYWTIAKKYNIEEVLKTIIEDKNHVVLQGEIVGEGIQKNKYGISGVDFYAFNIIFPDGRVSTKSVKNILDGNNIKTVPLLFSDKFLSGEVKDVIELSKGKSVLGNNVIREGIVLRNKEYNVSFKAINPDFLLKNDD